MRLLCLAVTLLTANAFAGEKVLLKLNFTENQRFEFITKINISSESLGFVKGTFHFAERAVKVTDKEIVQNLFVAGASFQAEGVLEAAKASFEEMKNFSFQRVLFTSAKVKEVAGMKAEAFGNAVDLVFSENPVEIGDSWVSSFRPNERLGDLEVTYKLVALDATDAKIEASVKKTNTVECIKPYIFVVDRATGHTKYSDGTLRVTAQGTAVDITFETKTFFPRSMAPKIIG